MVIYIHCLNAEQEKRISKTALCALHNIGRSKIHHINWQVSNGQQTAVPSQRGKHQNRPRTLSQEYINKVAENISSFSSEPSHYSPAKNPNRLYLSPLLSINKMFNEYKAKCILENIKPVSTWTYHRIFNTIFNMGFGSPKRYLFSM